MRPIWQPEAVIFVGLQGSGKSSLFKDRFFRSHVRINLDMLRTRHRETLLLRACIEMKQHFVVDNTNPTIAERAKYLQAARKGGFQIVGYYFPPDIPACLVRNEQRAEQERVPPKAILGTAKRLEPPALNEGFDKLYAVTINRRTFVIEDWIGR